MHQLRLVVCRRRANIPVQVRGEVPARRSVPAEQQSVLISAPVYQSMPVEQQSVPNSVLVQQAVPEEQRKVPEEFVAHTARAQAVPEEQRTVAERQSLAISARPFSAALNTSPCEPRKPRQHHA